MESQFIHQLDGKHNTMTAPLEMFGAWLAMYLKKADISRNDAAPAAKHVMASFMMLAAALFIDYRTGLRYNPLLFYVAVVLYVSWKSPRWYALLFVAMTLMGMAITATSDNTFFYDIVPAMNLMTTMVTLVLLSYTVIKFKDTALRLLEEKQARVDEQRMRSEQQRAFVATLSHEFRTPLNVISGQAQQLIATAGVAEPQKVISRSESIRNSTRRIQRLIDAFLLSQKIEYSQITYSPTLIDFEDVIGRSCRRLTESFMECELSLIFDNTPSIIEADETLIEYIMDNLLSNASKYSSKPAHIEVTGTGDGDFAIITVRDHGWGIAAEDIPQIFERYRRGRNVGRASGFGLGLHLVRNIVELHGGKVEVESALGSGSTFTVKLPRAARKVQQESSAS